MDPLPEEYLPPPPAYSEQEFDQKTSHATQLSIQTAKWEAPRAKLELDEDGWPRYDPALFETESVNPTKGSTTTGIAGSSSSPQVIKSVKPNLAGPSNRPSDRSNLPKIVPLRISKKSHLKAQEAAEDAEATPSQPYASTSKHTPPHKDDQYSLDGHGGMFQQPPYHAQAPSYSLESSPTSEAGFDSGEIISGHGRVGQQPPYHDQAPYHSEVQRHAPSYSSESSHTWEDGSSHSEDQRSTSEATAWTPTLEPLELTTPPNEAEPILSPPSSSDFRHSVVDPYYLATQQTSPRQSLPPPPIPRIFTPERPRSSQSMRPRPVSTISTVSQLEQVPRLSFNHHLAYGTSTMSSAPSRYQAPQKPAPMQYSAASFYNSAVSSQLGVGRPIPEQTPYQPYQPQYPSTQNYSNNSSNLIRAPAWQSPAQPSRPMSTYSTVSDASSYSGAVSNVTRYPQSHYSNNAMHSIPENNWYTNR